MCTPLAQSDDDHERVFVPHEHDHEHEAEHGRSPPRLERSEAMEPLEPLERESPRLVHKHEARSRTRPSFPQQSRPNPN
jgi:hypothetical protein